MTQQPSSSPLSAQQLEGLKSVLQEEKQWLEKQLEAGDHFGLNESLSIQTGELSAYDNHPADLGSEMFERSKDIALNENRERHYTDVNQALSRMDSGQYGLCDVCGTAIPFERLQAVPTTLYCKEHVPDPNASNDRPIEEELLVESWGSSNSPAMAENPNVSDNYNDMEIEADEQVGYVESFESFLATDMYGQHVSVVRNRAYHDYMHSGEGEGLLEPDDSASDYRD
jgi:YteA family regulatory protein